MRVRDRTKPAQLAELAISLDPPFELAIASGEPERLLVLQARAGTTVVRVFALPELREIVEARLSLKGESRLAALCGSVAVLLGGAESITAVDLAKLRAAALPVRGPIQVVAQLSAEQVIVGARGKLEVWSLEERRPTHRLTLALPRDAGFGGVLSQGRLLWVASSGPAGIVSLFRVSDGKQLGASPMGGAIKAIAAGAASTTMVVAVQPDGGAPLQLLALDVETQAQRVLALEHPVVAFCLMGAPADAVAILSALGPPVVLPLSMGTSGAAPRPIVSSGAGATPAAPEASGPDPEALGAIPAARAGGASSEEPGDAADDAIDNAPDAPPTTTDDDATGASAGAEVANDLAARLNQWRTQVQAAVVAAPPRPLPQGERGARTMSDEPPSRSRAELYAWGQAARSRTTTTPPPPPQGFRLSDLAVRFQIDMRSKSLVALLYASWLDGDGRRGVPVGVLARALGNDEAAWIEALAQGRLARLGWLTSSHGRTRLRGVVGRFLDEAAPRVALWVPADDAVASLVPPAGPALWRFPDRATLAHDARALANRLRSPVAMIDAAVLPAARFESVLASRVLEARLHGALPIVVPFEASPFDPHMLDGPSLVALDAASRDPWRGLPAWPEPEARAPLDQEAKRTLTLE